MGCNIQNQKNIASKTREDRMPAAMSSNITPKGVLISSNNINWPWFQNIKKSKKKKCNQSIY